MQLGQVFQTSFVALNSNRLRTSLTMLGIIIGISSVILISSIGAGAVAFITNQLSIFGTNFFRIAPGTSIIDTYAGTTDPLTTKDADAIKKARLPNVQLVMPVTFSSRNVSTADEKAATRIYGMTSDGQYILKPEIAYGEFISEADNNNAAKVAVLGQSVVEKFFGENSNPVGESIRIDNARFRIVGVTKSVGGIADIFNNGVTIPINTMIQDITGEDELFEIVISIKNENLLNQTENDVTDLLRDYRGIVDGDDNDFFTQSFKETLNLIQTVTSLLTLMVAGISGISLVVGGVGVMNIMLVTVTERTKEIGLLKAIGARENDILTQFLIESITLTLFGGFIGIIVGVVGAFVISQIAKIPFIIDPTTCIIAVGISTLVGILFGLYPARKAARLHPIEALRFE